jgi:1,2-diacylglycerol 3-beta-glucosyltransferase
MLTLQVVCTLLVTLAAAVCLYHLILAVVGLWIRRKSADIGQTSRHRFAIVVPAHNEEATLGATLDCLSSLDYPKDKCHVYVIADNCTDGTARVAEREGVTCLARQDPQRRGKGYALEWAFPRVLSDGWDALVVLDADCSLDTHALRSFDRHLISGHRVLQANDAVANVDQNSLTYLLGLANFLENDLFYAPKSALGLAVFLRGTGMVFHRSILMDHPWAARSLVEDMEYSYRLLNEGIRVRFVREVRVLSDFPACRGQLSVQRSRWIRGAGHVACTLGLRSLWNGFRRRKLLWIDAGLSAFFISRSLVAGQLLLTLATALLCAWLDGGAWSRITLFSTVGCFAAYLLYASLGVALSGVTARRLRFLLETPLVVARYVWMAVRTALVAGPTVWERTPRVDLGRRP